MTNGEKLEQVFPDGICPFSKVWLDSEYKHRSDPKLLQDYGNKIAIQTLTMLKYRLDTYADEHCSGDDINIYDVFKVIDRYVEDLERTLGGKDESLHD